jgi:hypothetical protein
MYDSLISLLDSGNNRTASAGKCSLESLYWFIACLQDMLWWMAAMQGINSCCRWDAGCVALDVVAPYINMLNNYVLHPLQMQLNSSSLSRFFQSQAK